MSKMTPPSLAAILLAATLSAQAFSGPAAFAETAQEFYAKGQTAYSGGNLTQAASLFQQATLANPDFVDAYYNLGAVHYNLKHYDEALDAFNHVLQHDPEDQAARFETGRIFEKLKRQEEAIAAFEMINPASSRYASAQEHVAQLREKPAGPAGPKTTTTPPATASQAKVTTATPAAAAVLTATTPPKTTTPEKTPAGSVAGAAGTTAVAAQATIQDAALTKPTTYPASPGQAILQSRPQAETVATSTIEPTMNLGPNAMRIPEDFVDGLAGPTGIAVDDRGTVYVANFSKNTIYKITPKGEKKLLAAGDGINGPVGLTLDHKTGDLYIANHLDNTVARITPDGRVSVVASGLKKPYNLYLDETHRTLYVSQQENNSIARIRLN